MMAPTEDRDLREAFRHLRFNLEGAGRLPSFDRLIERARLETMNAPTPGRTERSRRIGRALFPWLSGVARAGLAAAAVTGILLTSGARDPEQEFRRLVSAYTAASSSLWRSPTSRLLDVPGLELVRFVPSIGISVPGNLGNEPPDPPAPTRESRS
jgi:hypothetical protein